MPSACCVLPVSEPAKPVSQSPTLSPPPPSLSQSLCVSVQTLACAGRMLSAPASITTGLPRSPAVAAAADWLVCFSSPVARRMAHREGTRLGARVHEGRFEPIGAGQRKKRAIPNGAIFWISHRHESGSLPAAAVPGPTCIVFGEGLFPATCFGSRRGSTDNREAADVSV